MKKNDLVEIVREKADLPTRKQAQDAVDAVFDAITKALASGDEVTITGFGTFRTTRRAARMGVNPKTGEKIEIPASTMPKFKAGKALKDAVK